MTDRELLELAAKAAGYHWPLVWPHPSPVDVPHDWNPLTNDGDALRLAVKLGMLVSIINHPDLMQVEVTAYPPDKRPYGRIVTESLGTEHYAATRRAIVMAAAEIGRSMT